MPLLTDDAFKDLTALLALRLVVGEKDIASCESTIVGQFNVALILRNLSEEVGRQCRHDAGPVPRIGFATTGSTMLHASQHFTCVFDDLMGPFAFDIRDETNATGIVLIGRVIEAICGRVTIVRRICHSACLKSVRECG